MVYRKAKIKNLMSFNSEKLMSKFKLQYRRFLVLYNSTCVIPLVNRLIKYLENDWSLWLQYAIKKKKEWHEHLLFEPFLSGRSDRIRTCGIDVPNAKMPIFSLLYKAFRGFCVRNQCFRLLLQALFPRSPKL